MPRKQQVDWYFDFISPYAWLQAETLDCLPPGVQLRCKPVLFAALLEHWGQLGPAEIAPKRVFTYRYIVWRAVKLGLRVHLPPSHPFNPLPLLRLAIVLGNEPQKMRRLFRFVWSEGKLPEEASAWRSLVEELGVPDAQARIAAPEVKMQLRSNGEEAIAAGVFGVPTLVIDGTLFWGVDATDMAADYLRRDSLFESELMRRAATLPEGNARRRR